MTKSVTREAGHSIETAMRKGKAVEKKCLRCGCGIGKRKTYCGPCYSAHYDEMMAASRHKYANPKS